MVKAALDEVAFYEKVRNEVKLASGDFVDLKLYEPAMRHLINAYIRAEDSEKISAFDDMTLIQLIVERDEGAIDALPQGIKNSQEAVAETIKNNVRKLIIDETPVNLRYYEQMSQLLDDLIEQRRTHAINYEKYLARISALAGQVAAPQGGKTRPPEIDTPERKALYDFADDDVALAAHLDFKDRLAGRVVLDDHHVAVLQVLRLIGTKARVGEEQAIVMHLLGITLVALVKGLTSIGPRCL